MLFLFWSCHTCPDGFILNDGVCTQSIQLQTSRPEASEPSANSTINEEQATTPTPEELEEWHQLPASCLPPEELPEDPIQQEESLFAQATLFAEMLDLEIDEENNEAWAVGQGGLMRFSLEPELQLTEYNDHFGARFYHVALGAEQALYATHREFGLFMFQRSSSIEPIQVRQYSDLSDMAVTEEHLYITSLSGELLTFSIEDPYTPELLHTTTTLAAPWIPIVSGSHLYVADNTLGLVSFDREIPSSPTFIENNFEGGGLLDLAITEDGQFAYGAAGGTGLSVYRLDEGEITWLTSIPLNHSLLSVDLKNEKLWATSHQDLVLFDISTPSSPRLINTEKTEQWAMAVAAWQADALVADWGYLSLFSGSTSTLAPDLDLSSEELHIESTGGYRTVVLRNLGNAPLELSGAQSSHELWFEQTTIPPAESTRMVLYASAENSAQTSICIASNDPDTPQHILNVGSTGIGNSPLGREAPAFSLEALDGNTYTLSEQQGKPVVLIYFATW